MLLATTVSILVPLVGTVRSSANDDTWIHAVMSGAWTGHRSARTGVTSIFFSGPISGLYRIGGEIPWYPLIIVGGWVVCLAVASAAVFSVNQRLSVQVVAMLTIASLAVPPILSPSYTSLAVGLGGAGLIAASSAHTARSPRRSRKWWGSAVVLLTASSLVRWHGFLVMVAIGLPVLATAIRRDFSTGSASSSGHCSVAAA